MKRLIRAAAVAMTIGIASAASAQPTADDIRKAAEQFDLGRRAFKNQEYVEAAEHFEQADLFAPSAGALKLALQARLKAEQTQRAAVLAYLAQQRHGDNEDLMSIAKPVLAEAKKEFHLLTVKCDEPCELIVGTKLVHGQPDTERGIFLEPGTHKVRANWSERRTQTKEMKAAKGAASTLTFEAPPIPEEPEPVVVPPPGGGTDTGGGSGGQPGDGGIKDDGGGLPPGVFFTMAGVTAVLGGVTAWSGIDTQNNPGKDKVREECRGQGDTCELYQEGVDKQNRTNILAGATAVVGVATIIVGIVTDWGGDETAGKLNESQARAKRRRSKPSIEPWLSVGNGAALGAMGRF